MNQGNVLLLVDDNEQLLRFVSSNLASAFGCLDIVTARCLSEALGAAARRHPRVVIVDRRLPDGDGVDLARRLALGQRVPKIVLVTGDDHTPVADADPVDTVLIKPYSLDDLVGAVGDVLRGITARCGPTRPAPPRPVSRQELGIRSHRARNLLTGIHAGIRAFAADVRASAHDADRVTSAADAYEVQLIAMVREMSVFAKREGGR